ncbi:hypothetical protein HID58_089924 [Brassica napus]|uniref:BnaCnng02720D protein n=2 Tax=Brassica napus TaxID=3708 RepID=A0A078FAD1_BRANA|nr:hypothetical protein HID58_089924 [Brassica napus]CAF1792080.1 unnamed protein product [Brassica napus]CDY10371.1 BnaCnng02720D [Brassica napus]
MKKNPLTQSEDLTIKGFKRFRFSLGDGQKHKSTHTKDCMKVDEDKLGLSFVISRMGNFDPLASFGSPRNQQIISILLY